MTTSMPKYLLLLMLAAITVADFNACQINTNDGLIDLNPARSSSGFYKVLDPSFSKLWEYYVQICDTVRNFEGSGVCQKIYPHAQGYQIFSDRTGCFPLVSSSAADISLTLTNPNNTRGGVTLRYAALVFDNYRRTLEVGIACDPAAGDDTPLNWVTEEYTWGQSKFILSGKSKYACPVQSN